MRCRQVPEIGRRLKEPGCRRVERRDRRQGRGAPAAVRPKGQQISFAGLAKVCALELFTVRNMWQDDNSDYPCNLISARIVNGGKGFALP